MHSTMLIANNFFKFMKCASVEYHCFFLTDILLTEALGRQKHHSFSNPLGRGKFQLGIRKAEY